MELMQNKDLFWTVQNKTKLSRRFLRVDYGQCCPDERGKNG